MGLDIVAISKIEKKLWKVERLNEIIAGDMV